MVYLKLTNETRVYNDFLKVPTKMIKERQKLKRYVPKVHQI